MAEIPGARKSFDQLLDEEPDALAPAAGTIPAAEAPAEAAPAQPTAAQTVQERVLTPQPSLAAPPAKPTFAELLEQEPDAFGDPKADLAAQAGAAARVATGDVVRMSGVGPAAAIGVTAGAVGGPVGMLFGGIAGVGLGFLAGDLAADELERRDLAVQRENLPPELQPGGVAGEVLAGAVTAATVPFTALATGVARPLAAAARPALAPITATSFAGRAAQASVRGVRLAPSAVGRFAEGVLTMAEQNPKAFLGAEGLMASSAALAEGVFEAAVPGEPLARTAAGVVAGFANIPRHVFITLPMAASRLVRGLSGKMSTGAQMGQAGRLLRQFFEAEGQDPDTVVEMLKDTQALVDTIPGFRATLAQTTGNFRSAQLEAELAEKYRVFGADTGQQARDTVTAITNAIALLQHTADPGALRVAAELTRARMVNVMEMDLQLVQTEAAALAQQIQGVGTAADRAKLSLQMGELLEKSIERARAIEAQLWTEALPNADNIPSPWRAYRKASSALKGEIPIDDALPASIAVPLARAAASTALLKRAEAGETLMPDGSKITAKAIAQARRAVSVGELQRVRTKLLARVRDLNRSTADVSSAEQRQLSVIADAILDDMVRAGVATKPTARPGVFRGAGGRLTAEETAFDVARKFSRDFNDTYTRSLVGQAQQAGPFGLRMQPEALVKMAIGTGDELSVLRIRELQEAIDFLPVRQFSNPAALDEITADARLMMDLQSRAMHLFASRVLEERLVPETGEFVTRISASKARAFLKNAAPVLEKFPEVRALLEAGVKSEDTFAQMVRNMKGELRRIDGSSVIGKLLKVESPADAIAAVISGRRPVEQLSEMADLATANGEEAVSGLRAAIWDQILRKARLQPGADRFDLTTLVTSFTAPVRPGLPSLRDVMIDKGLMEPAVAARMDELIETAVRVNEAILVRPRGEEILAPPNLLTATFVRGSGAVLGRAALHAGQAATGITGGGPELVVSGAAANAATQLLQSMPREATAKLIMDAVSGKSVGSQVSGFRRLVGGIRTFVGLDSGIEPVIDQPWSLLKLLLDSGGTEAQKLQRVYLLHAYAWTSGLLGIEDEFLNAPSQEDSDDMSIPPAFRPRRSPANTGVFDPRSLDERTTPALTGGEGDTELGSGGGQDTLGPLGTEVVGRTPEGRVLIRNPDGSVSSERSATERLSDGRWVNFPTIFGGKELPVDEAIAVMEANGWVDPETGRPADFFKTREAAVEAAKARSASLGPQGRATPKPKPSVMSSPQAQVPSRSEVLVGPRVRGERNNNPMNLGRTRIKWEGKIAPGDEERFEVFQTAFHGLRAGARNLRTLHTRGPFPKNEGDPFVPARTVEALINAWAPPKENDTGSYVRAVARDLGVRPDDPIDLTANPRLMESLVAAIIKHENGRNIYRPELIQKAVAAALAR